MAGISIDWSEFYADEQRYRVPLPTYPFEPQRYWLDPRELEAQLVKVSLPEEPLKQSSHNLTEPSKAYTASITVNSTNEAKTLMHPRPVLKTTFVSPRNEIEQTIANIWQSFLSIEQIGVHDNFFELGGHSLQTIQIISRVREAFQIDINAQDFFQAHTVGEVAELITNSKFNQENFSDITKTLEEVESLTKEKVQEELSKELQGNGKGSVAVCAEAAEISKKLQVNGKEALTVCAEAEEPSKELQVNGKEALTVSAEVASKQSDIGSRKQTSSGQSADMQFSIYFFSADESALTENKYELVLEGAKFVDRSGFTAIWTPERHFHQFGGLYPNPSVLSAALAMVTENIQIRAGSTVLPLHHPVRTAEEWSVVDNLSKGRVGICCAPGFHPNDFVFAPENFAKNKEIMFRNIQIVQRLWQGEPVSMCNGTRDNIRVKIFPKPIQPKLPIWISATGNPATFVKAGELGVNILTSLIGLTFDELAERIGLYREALVQHGHDPEEKKVSLMIHTFMGEDIDAVKEKVREPYCNYLRVHSSLITTMTQSLGASYDTRNASEDDLDYLFSSIFERHLNTRVLFGTPSSCLPVVKRLQSIGVNEIASLIDFGIDFNSTMKSLYYLNELKAQVISHK
jgi:natural product biosynthesis luciferase-like monooxygenase protein